MEIIYREISKEMSSSYVGLDDFGLFVDRAREFYAMDIPIADPVSQGGK
jgi:polyhydroxyalkanoate synthesis regulator protein